MQVDLFGVSFTEEGWRVLKHHPTWSLKAAIGFFNEQELARRRLANGFYPWKSVVDLYLCDPTGICYDFHLDSAHCRFDTCKVQELEVCNLSFLSTLMGSRGHPVLDSVHDLVTQYLAVEQSLVKKKMDPVKYM